MLFDSINEVFDYHRVGKTFGQKMPPKMLWNCTSISDPRKIDNIFSSVLQTLTELSIFLCGFIEDKDESFLQSPFIFDEDILNQIKEDRMYKLLQNDVKEYELKLQSNDDEFYEIGLEISNMMFEYLIDDVIEFTAIKN